MSWKEKSTWMSEIIALSTSQARSLRSVLVLPGAIFFIIAIMGLCFGLVMKSVDNSGMFSLLLSRAYTESRPFLLLTSPPQWAGRWHRWESWPCVTQGTSCTIGHHSQQAGRRRNRRTFRAVLFNFPSHRFMCWSPAFLGMAKHLPLGSGELIPFIFAQLLLPLLNGLCLNKQVFSLFQFSPPSHQGGVSERLCRAELLAGIKSRLGFKCTATLRKMCNTLTTVKVLMVSAFPDFMQPRNQLLSLRFLLWCHPKQMLWEESKNRFPFCNHVQFRDFLKRWTWYINNSQSLSSSKSLLEGVLSNPHQFLVPTTHCGRKFQSLTTGMKSHFLPFPLSFPPKRTACFFYWKVQWKINLFTFFMML